MVGNALFSEYLQLHYVAGTGELAVLVQDRHQLAVNAGGASQNLALLQEIRTEWDALNDETQTPLHNRAIFGGRAPGSIFKIVTAAAGAVAPACGATTIQTGAPNLIDSTQTSALSQP